MLFLHILHGVRARKSAAQAHLEILVRAQTGAAAAAKSLLADGVLRHLVELVADALEDRNAALQAAPSTRAGLQESWKVATQ